MRFKKNVHEKLRIRRMKRFQPWDRCWLNSSDLQSSWLKQTKSFFKDLHCCAICGVTKLSNRNKKYRFLHNTYLDGVALMQGCAPYGTTNTCIAKHTTNASVDKMILCNQCHSNRRNPPYAPYVVYQPPAYMKSIVTLNPLHVQLLSFMDIGVHMQSKDWGFSTGKIVFNNFLNSLLFGWAENYDAYQTIENLVSSLTHCMLSQNLHTNPFFQKYMTIFEQPEKNTSMCILTPDVIQPIIANIGTHSMSFPTMDVPRDVYDLALLFDMRTQTRPRKHADFFTIKMSIFEMVRGLTLEGAYHIQEEYIECRIGKHDARECAISFLISTWTFPFLFPFVIHLYVYACIVLICTFKCHDSFVVPCAHVFYKHR